MHCSSIASKIYVSTTALSAPQVVEVGRTGAGAPFAPIIQPRCYPTADPCPVFVHSRFTPGPLEVFAGRVQNPRRQWYWVDPPVLDKAFFSVPELHPALIFLGQQPFPNSDTSDRSEFGLWHPRDRRGQAAYSCLASATGVMADPRFGLLIHSPGSQVTNLPTDQLDLLISVSNIQSLRLGRAVLSEGSRSLTKLPLLLRRLSPRFDDADHG